MSSLPWSFPARISSYSDTDRCPFATVYLRTAAAAVCVRRKRFTIGALNSPSADIADDHPYGSAISNYDNQVKLALLEKGVEFRDERTIPSQNAAVLVKSPLGKNPLIETDPGRLSESRAILHYLEDACPDKPLQPAGPYARTQCRELLRHLEANVELVARRLCREAFAQKVAADRAQAPEVSFSNRKP